MQTELEKPLISIKEARKILGELARSMTNEEIVGLINQLEHLARLGVNAYMVRKNDKLK